MRITLSPTRNETRLTLERKGSTLVFNGDEVDLRTYRSEETSHDWIVDQPTKVGKEWQVQIRLPHGPNAPDETKFPAPLSVIEDGPVSLPPYEVSTDD